MSDEIKIDDISFVLTGNKYEIKNKGTVYTAQLTCIATRDKLTHLIGKKIKLGKILGVESFAVDNQDYKVIGLLAAPEGQEPSSKE